MGLKGMNTDWSEYFPNDSKVEDSDDWVVLETLRHTAHLSAARRIAEDEQILSQLIYDGTLKSTRMKGLFLSPNHWSMGYIYGSIQLSVPVEKILLNGRKIYWIEVIDTYSIPVFRFLASRSCSLPTGAKLYNPQIEKGPIRQIDGFLYRPKNYIIEIIVDEDLPLASFHTMSFVSHHPDYCIRKQKDCREKGSYQKAWGALMGFLLGNGLTAMNPLLCVNGGLTSDAMTALSFLLDNMTRGNTAFGGPVLDYGHADYLLKSAMLDLFEPEARRRGRALVSMLKTEELFNKTFESIVSNHFGVPKFGISDLAN